MLARGFGTLSVVISLFVVGSCTPAAPVTTPTAVPKATIKPPAATPAAAAAKPVAQPNALEQLIEGARKEGMVKAMMSPRLGNKGAERLIGAFNKKYNLNLRLEYTPEAKWTGMVGQLMTELQAGGRPSADVYLATPRHFHSMAKDGLILAYDWTRTFSHIPQSAVLVDGTFITFITDNYVPAYNPNMVKPEDVPRKWDDLLDPKWKMGLVAGDSAGPWVKLTEAWGEARVTEFVVRLAKQEPVFVNFNQVVPKVTSGEYAVAAFADVSLVFEAQAVRAPIRLVEDVGHTVSYEIGLAMPRGAQNPNAARLFIAFQLTPEAVQIWWEEAKYSTPFVPGRLAEFMKGKEAVYNTIEFLNKEDKRLEEKYSKILGLK